MTRRYHFGSIALLIGALAAQAQPAASLGRPVATLGRPRPLHGTASAPAHVPGPVIRLSSHESEPSSADRVFNPSFDPPPPFTPPADSGYYRSDSAPADSTEALLTGRPAPRKPDDRYQHTSNFGEKFRERMQEWFSPGYQRECDTRRWFESDHTFDYFASPVTMPFLLEDPRSLTEIRPVFLFQSIPNTAPSFQGGHAEFFGTQIRVAFTERFSFVMNKLGFVNISPGAGAVVPGGTGFAEVVFGPKFTFLRNQDRCMLAAAGLNFQVPAGPASVYQDTGRLSMVPYISFGKNFLDSRFGSLNFINTTGYSFSGDGERSDYLYSSFHLSFDVANKHRFYPLLELHYVQYTGSGGARNLDVEGRDLANIGDVNSGGRANFNIAPGLRYKLTEKAQIGFAAEFPLNSRKDLQQFRFTLDFIWRY